MSVLHDDLEILLSKYRESRKELGLSSCGSSLSLSSISSRIGQDFSCSDSGSENPEQSDSETKDQTEKSLSTVELDGHESRRRPERTPEILETRDIVLKYESVGSESEPAVVDPDIGSAIARLEEDEIPKSVRELVKLSDSSSAGEDSAESDNGRTKLRLGLRRSERRIEEKEMIGRTFDFRAEYFNDETLSLEIMEFLGEGRFGSVFRVEDKKSKNQFAIKFEEPDSKPKLLRKEYLFLTRLHGGSNVVSALGYQNIRTLGCPGILMQLLGPNLDDLMRYVCDGRFSLKTCCMIACQGLTAIEFIHNKGIIHRDIKPENFMMGPVGQGGGEQSRGRVHRKEALQKLVSLKEEYEPSVLCNTGKEFKGVCSFFEFMNRVFRLGFAEAPVYHMYRNFFNDELTLRRMKMDYKYDWVILAEKRDRNLQREGLDKRRVDCTEYWLPLTEKERGKSEIYAEDELEILKEVEKKGGIGEKEYQDLKISNPKLAAIVKKERFMIFKDGGCVDKEYGAEKDINGTAMLKM